jgi:type 1 glutamine amidotransferase
MRETRMCHSFSLGCSLPRLNDPSFAPIVSTQVYGGGQIQYAYRGHSASHTSNSPVDG